MNSSIKFLFLLALVVVFAIANGRDLVHKDETEVAVKSETVESSTFCQLCEQIATEAQYYFSENETETEIISILRQACSKLDYFKSQCVTLVDYYIPLFFDEVANLSPDDFCEKVKLCKDESAKIANSPKIEIAHVKKTEKSLSSGLCTICGEFAEEALSYIQKNETETEIISILEKACSKLDYFEEECVALVDYYVPLYFVEVETVTPEKFCEKINFCTDDTSLIIHLPKLIKNMIRSPKIHKKENNNNDDACTLCEEAVEQILTKLKDPDTELEIVEILLKGCTKAVSYVQQCKKLVLQYGPLFLSNIEKFLETKDICTSIHACQSSAGATVRAKTLSSA